MRFLFCFALYMERSLTKRKQQETRGKVKRNCKIRKELLEGNTAKQFWSLDNISTKWMSW